MGETDFNPYHKWLGIPPAEQPPNHYRLLGIELNETDLDVIESAADQRMSHLRTFQGGKNAQLSQKLLNEVATARICLMKPETRAAYDESLNRQEKKSDSSVPPPIRVADRPPVRKTTPIIPIAIVASLFLVVIGTVFAIVQFGRKNDDAGSSQVASKSDRDNEGKKSGVKKSEQRKSGSKKEGLDGTPLNGKPLIGNSQKTKKPNGDSGKANTTKASDKNDVADKGKSNSTENNKGETVSGKKSVAPGNNVSQKMPTKMAPETDPKKGSPDSQPEKSDPEKDEKKGEPAKDDPPKSEPKKNGDKAEVVRGAIPHMDLWKPLIPGLKKEYEISSDLSRDSRFAVFHKLIKDAKSEPIAEKAYARFNLAEEQAKLLNHAAGIESYCSPVCDRFECDKLRVQTLYLKSIAESLTSKLHVAQFLVEAQKIIRLNDLKDGKVKPAVILLQSIVDLSEQPIGKNIDKSYFEDWLRAEKRLLKIASLSKQLKEKENGGTLTPDDHRRLGTYYLFVEKLEDLGFKHLAKCGYKPIVDIAKNETEDEFVDIKSIADIAEDWWVLSSKFKDEKYLFKLRSKYWYDKFLNRALPSEITKKIQKRMETLSPGIGLKRVPNVRVPSKVIAINNERGFQLEDATETVHIDMPSPDTIGVYSNDFRTRGGGLSLFQIFRTGTQAQIFETESSNAIVPTPPKVFSGKFAWMASSNGNGNYVYAFDLTNEGEKLVEAKTPTSSFRFKIPERLRSFAIGDNGDVYGMGQTHLHWWNPRSAWKKGFSQSDQGKPNSMAMPVPFTPSKIRVVPNSSIVVLSNSENMSTFNPLTKAVIELHAKSQLIDYDFASNGGALVTALKNGVKYRAFKGDKNLFFQTAEPKMVRFFPNPRFFVTLHKDHSLRIWDALNKDSNFLADRVDLPNYEPELFAVASDGSSITLVDDESRYVILDLLFE